MIPAGVSLTKEIARSYSLPEVTGGLVKHAQDRFSKAEQRRSKPRKS